MTAITKPDSAKPTIYEELGITPVINASGPQTVLGGSILSPGVQQALEAANVSFASMAQVFEKTGAVIANLLRAEDAYVTSGCFAALVLSAAAAMTVNDHSKIAQLPDTTGLKNEFLIQKKLRYHYDKCMSVAGGKLVEVGDEQETTVAQMEAAIGPRTAGILYLASNEGTPGTLTIPQMVEIADKAGIALILDAAGEVYPLERMTSLPSCGAALICYGAKYIGSSHSSGILSGKRSYVEAAKLNGFVSYETVGSPGYENTLGRGYKVDRQEIIATTVALQEWMVLDHEERLQTQAQRIDTIMAGLADVPHIKAENVFDEEGGAWMRLRLSLDVAQLGKSASQITDLLKAGTPCVWVRPTSESTIHMTVHTLLDGEDLIVAEKLREALVG